MQESEKTFETEVLTRLAVIESKLDGYKELKKTAYDNEARSKKNEQDIEEIKEENKWLRRAIIGEGIGLLFAIITILIKRGMGVN